MGTELVKLYGVVEAGRVADAVAAQTIFARALATLSPNTRRARAADLATLDAYLTSAAVDTTGCAWGSDPACWADVTYGLVSGFVQWLLQQGQAIASVNRKLSTVRSFCGLAAQAGTLAGDELARIQTIRKIQYSAGVELDKGRDTTRVGSKKSTSVELDATQVKALKELVSGTPQAARDRLLLCLMLDQALRVSEVALLTVDAFDLRRGTFTFYRPKTKNTETHRLTSATADALATYLDQPGAPGVGLLLCASDKTGRLLAGGMSERAITKRVNNLAKMLLGVPNLSAHDLRHSAATRAARGGTSLSALMGLGGWKSVQMAMRYVDRQRIANDGVKFDD